MAGSALPPLTEPVSKTRELAIYILGYQAHVACRL
jgi:hypothetical protein